MPLRHSPTPHAATPNPEQGQQQQDGAPGRAHCIPCWTPAADLLGSPSVCLHARLFPISSPLPPARAPAFHFPFTVGNLTSPLSAFRLFLRWSPFFPFPLFSHTQEADYLFYFCPINSSVMVPGGKPTATKPPAVDTSTQFVGLPSPLFRY